MIGRIVSNLAHHSVSKLARVVMVLALSNASAAFAEQQDVFADIELGYLNAIGQSESLSSSNAAPSLVRSRIGVQWGRTEPASFFMIVRPDAELYRGESGQSEHWDGRIGPVAQPSRSLSLLDAYELSFDQNTGWRISTGVRESFDEQWRINEQRIPFGLRVVEPGGFYFAEVKWKGRPRTDGEDVARSTQASILVSTGDQSRNNLIADGNRKSASSSDSMWGGGAWFSVPLSTTHVRMGSFYENKRTDENISSDLFIVLDSVTAMTRMAMGSALKSEFRWRSLRQTKGDDDSPSKEFWSGIIGLQSAVQETSFVDLNLGYGKADANIDEMGFVNLTGFQADVQFRKKFSNALFMSAGLGFEHRTRTEEDADESEGAFGSLDNPESNIWKGMFALNYWVGRD
jgi:hypothetical protein